MANSEWRNVKLEEVAREITVGFVGSMVQEYVPDGIPFLRSQNVEPFQITDKDLKFISPTFHKRIKKSALAPGDVVIVRTGKPGACALIPDWLTDANCSDIVIVRCGPELDARFLTYYVNSVASHHVASHTVGAVQQHFNVGAARKLQLHLPPLAEQRRIAHILGTLDDKIELNRQLNATLEQLARTLFQSWFVDFDPVRAKASGEAPDSICRRLGLTPELLALFPAELEASALGEVPAEWEIGRLADVLHILSGFAFKSSSFHDAGEYALVTIRNVQDGQFIGDTKEFVAELPSKMPAYCLLSSGDILLSLTGNVGRICFVIGDNYILNQRVAKIVAKKDGERAFAYFLMRREEVKSHLIGISKGTAQLNLSPIETKQVQIVLPPTRLRKLYAQKTEPIFQQLITNEEESRTLAALRDELLPKLLAGDLRLN